jgi:hypoxanthine phosphoribosyltransferase
MVQLKDKAFDILISEEKLLNRVRNMAGQISKEYTGRFPLFLAVLNGSFMFAADLLRHINIPCEISFIKIASYQQTHSTGKLTRLIGLSDEVSGRHIIILEDIVDTGITIEGIIEELQKKNPASVQVATLLHKPEAYIKQVPLQYIGFSIPNQFVVGYGLDYDQQGRNLKDLYVLQDDLARHPPAC